MPELQEQPRAAKAGQRGTESDERARGSGVNGVDVRKGEIAVTECRQVAAGAHVGFLRSVTGWPSWATWKAQRRGVAIGGEVGERPPYARRGRRHLGHPDAVGLHGRMQVLEAGQVATHDGRVHGTSCCSTIEVRGCPLASRTREVNRAGCPGSSRSTGSELWFYAAS